jgi:hypothetical protein
MSCGDRGATASCTVQIAGTPRARMQSPWRAGRTKAHEMVPHVPSSWCRELHADSSFVYLYVCGVYEAETGVIWVGSHRVIMAL